MKNRIRGILCGGLGLLSLLAGGLFAVSAVAGRPRPDAGVSLVTLVKHYGLRDEILLVALGVTLLLAAAALFLSPGLGWVAIAEAQAVGGDSEKSAAPDTSSLADAASFSDPAPEAASSKGISRPSSEPRPVCYLRTRLMGGAFSNSNGSSRQSALGQLRDGDILVCRSPGEGGRADTATETVGVFTVNGRCLGFLDAAFLRSLRDRYPGCRIGVEVERITGGGVLPYTCDLRVAVYRL